jgi:hypothetical protein
MSFHEKKPRHSYARNLQKGWIILAQVAHRLQECAGAQHHPVEDLATHARFLALESRTQI